MLEPLRIPKVYAITHPLEAEPFSTRAYLFVADAGNALVDPLPLDDSTRAQIEQLGGIARVVVMTPERRGAAEGIATRYSSDVVAEPAHREPLFAGAVAIRLAHQRRSHEFAISIPAIRAVVAGDSLVGIPAGALSMSPEGDYADARKAALGLRAILRENPDALLLTSGQPIFTGAYAALYRTLYERAGAEIHRINLDELDVRDERGERVEQPSIYHIRDAEVGFVVGARRLGYRVSTLGPGRRFCPLHSHAREEELFFVLEGQPSVRTLAGTIRCRKGDFIAFPVGASGTHQLVNESDAPATVMLLARSEDVEACYYPDSDKLLLDTDVPIAEGVDSFIVAASPQLDYFHGEDQQRQP
ncbi:MAG: cupin domain-containing protein [Candidatus Eremiobacteraeota bacterium]|nr:cupin domain-containing protein [Candidatus Eremiobacteraeota bacterium]